VYDRFVLQEEQAVDYRTSASEIRAQDVDGLMNRDAVSLKQVCVCVCVCVLTWIWYVCMFMRIRVCIDVL
jgi:hypothetical protein